MLEHKTEGTEILLLWCICFVFGAMCSNCFNVWSKHLITTPDKLPIGVTKVILSRIFATSF